MNSNPQATPLTHEYFSARLKALGVNTAFAIAVSGGRDSMALARLSAAYGKANNISVSALTVDHRLRPEASREAVQVSAWCKAIGLPHRTLVWDGEKPATGVQEAAREARYALMVKAAQEAGADALLTAHSADDQAETVFMRLSRGAGPGGLSGMREVSLIAVGPSEPIRLVRPLLSISRRTLTATVNEFRQAFIDDPSNDDPAYERIRTRALLAALEEQGLLTQEALQRTAMRMQQAHRSQRMAEDALFRSLGGCFYRWGGTSLDLRAARDIGVDERRGLYMRLIFAVSGQARLPNDDATQAMVEQALAGKTAVSGGAMAKTHGGRLWFFREPAAMLGRAGMAPLAPVSLSGGEALLWDHRFIVKAEKSCAEAEIAAVGEHSDANAAAMAMFSGPREARLAAPGVFRGGALIGAAFALSTTMPGMRFVPLCRERFDGEINRFSQNGPN